MINTAITTIHPELEEPEKVEDRLLAEEFFLVLLDFLEVVKTLSNERFLFNCV